MVLFPIPMTKKSTKQIAFKDALAQLGATERPSEAIYRAFSDLDGDKLTAWHDVWKALPAARRILVVERMRELMETDIEVDFRPVFRHGLNDKEERVRIASIEGLEEDEHISLIDPLIALLRDDPSETVRAVAAESLGRFVHAGELERISTTRREQVYAVLMRALLTTQRESDSLVHRRALESLAYVTNEEMDLQIREAYDSPSDLLRLSAIVAMGRSQNRAYAETVRDELQSLSPAVRREAARASGHFEDEEAVPDLGPLLEDPDTSVRLATLDALAEIGGKDARDLVEAATNSDEEEFAAHAVDALEELDFFHGDIDFSLALFDEDKQKPTKILQPKTAADEE